MNSNFLEALTESQKLSEGPVTQAIGGAVNKVKDAIAQKNQQASAAAKTNTDALKPILDLLQPIANAQTEFTAENIKQIKDAINALPTLDNNSKKQINVMLNQYQQGLSAKEQNQPQNPANKTETTPQETAPQEGALNTDSTSQQAPQNAQESRASTENIVESQEFKNLEAMVNSLANSDKPKAKQLVATFNALKAKLSQNK